MKGEFLFKIHKSYRWVVAICDKDVYGQILEDKSTQLDLTTQFFDGEEINEKDLIEKIKACIYEDATFYIVGEKSTNLAKRIELIDPQGIKLISGIPFALILL